MLVGTLSAFNLNYCRSWRTINLIQCIHLIVEVLGWCTIWKHLLVHNMKIVLNWNTQNSMHISSTSSTPAPQKHGMHVLTVVSTHPYFKCNYENNPMHSKQTTALSPNYVCVDKAHTKYVNKSTLAHICCLHITTTDTCQNVYVCWQNTESDVTHLDDLGTWYQWFWTAVALKSSLHFKGRF